MSNFDKVFILKFHDMMLDNTRDEMFTMGCFSSWENVIHAMKSFLLFNHVTSRAVEMNVGDPFTSDNEMKMTPIEVDYPVDGTGNRQHFSVTQWPLDIVKLCSNTAKFN